MDILNVASPRSNDYNGDFSEKSVIIHAINYFKENEGSVDLGSIFFNISIPSQRRLISSILFSSPIFIDKTTNSDLWGQVDIVNDYKRLVITKEPEYVYNESIKPKQKPGINVEINTGVKIQDSRLDNTTINLNTQKSVKKKAIKPNIKSSWVEQVSWIVGIIAGLLALYQFFLKK